MRQIVDLVEASVVARGDQPLELAAGGAAGRIGVADRVALQRRQHRAYPGEHVLDGGEVHAHGIAERVDAVDELGGGVDVPHQLVAAVLGSHRGERVDQALDARHDLVDLGAHVAEAVGQRVGPGRQPVEVAGALADLGGAVGQPVADEARLIGGPELRRHLAEGSGDAADQTDVRQLGDARSHLLQVREGLRCAQVTRRLDEDVFGDGLTDGEMAFQRGVPDRTRRRRRHGLAIVVVEVREDRAAGQEGQHEHAGNQMCHRPAHDADAGTSPEPSSQFAPRLDPAARPGEHQNCRQQSHPGEVCHADTDRRRHSDRFEHAHLGEAQQRER